MEQKQLVKTNSQDKSPMQSKSPLLGWSVSLVDITERERSAEALREALDAGKQAQLRQMMEAWPFFLARVEMLEMVLSKADVDIARFYERRLASEDLWPLGKRLRDALEQATAAVLQLRDSDVLLAHNPALGESVAIRNPYTDPLHVLQAELMARTRAQGDKIDADLERALMVTMAGIAAGMRNTG